MIEDQVLLLHLYHLTKYENIIQSFIDFSRAIDASQRRRIFVLTGFESSSENQLYVL